MLPISVNGTGDVTSALFLAHCLRTGEPSVALARTGASVYAVLEETDRAKTREIQLIAAQDSIASPPDRFEARRVR